MSKTKTKNEYDPKMQALVTGNVDRASSLADSYTPYTGQLSAGTSPLMNDFFGAATNVQGAGQGLLGSAAGAAQSALGYQPMQVSAPTVGTYSAGPANTYDASQALGLLGGTQSAAGVDRGSVRDVNLGAFGADQIRALYNPFEQDKVMAALGDYEQFRLGAQNSDAARAAKAGAFGNTGVDVQSALTNEGAQRAANTAVNDLRYQGWNSAMQGALGARGQDLSAMQGNQSADLGVAGMNNQTGMFNTGQANDALRTGAGLLGQAGIFNAGAQNDVANADANRALTSGTANQAAQLEALLANQDAGLTSNAQQLTGAGLLGDLGQAQSSMGLQQASLLGQAGAAQQGLSQEALDRQYNAFLQDWQNKLAGQQGVTSATGIVPGVTNSTQTQSQGIGGIAQGLLGSLGTAAFGMGSLGFTPFGAKK